MARIAVLASGSGSNLEALIKSEKAGRLGAEIALVVSDRPDAYALVRANRYKKPVCLIEPKLFETREAYEKAVVSVLRKAGIDWVALAGFMRILSPYFIGEYRGRIVNIHPALLPLFKGAHAIRDAFEQGVKVTGVTVHFATENVDGGPIILQEPVPVYPKDTLKTLEKRIHALEHRLYPRAIRLVIEGKVKMNSRIRT